MIEKEGKMSWGRHSMVRFWGAEKSKFVEMDPKVEEFLLEKYSILTEDELTLFINKISYIYTGEMVP